MEDGDEERKPRPPSLSRQSNISLYTGIFEDEMGQYLLTSCLAQLDATLGLAWRACQKKEYTQTLFEKCLRKVRREWNERIFEQEAAVFTRFRNARASLKHAFVQYTKSMASHAAPMYRGSNKNDSTTSTTQLRITVPANVVFVTRLLCTAARHPEVRSGEIFNAGVAAQLARKDIAMQIIREVFDNLQEEFVIVQAKEEEGAEEPSSSSSSVTAHDEVAATREHHDEDLIRPEDSVSNVEANDEVESDAERRSHSASSHTTRDKTPSSSASASRASHLSRSSSSAELLRGLRHSEDEQQCGKNDHHKSVVVRRGGGGIPSF